MTTAQGRVRLLGSREVGGVIGVDDVAGLVDQLRPHAAREDALLVVAAAAEADAVRHTLSLARAGAPGATGVVHASTLPPLARRGLVEVLGSMQGSFTAGQLLVVCEALERTMTAGAAVTSVARLADPGPSMAQHVQSWWPSSRFVVLTHPHRVIVPVTGVDTAAVRLPEVDVPMHFACTGGDDATAAVVDDLARRLTGQPATVVEAPAESRARWASRHFTEFSALPQDLSVLVRTALDAATECRSCGAPVAWTSCRFCHAAAPLETTAATATAPAAQAATTAALAGEQGAA
ncbi:hypothetical protein GCM10027446_08190 [Angustibacter peucedani]